MTKAKHDQRGMRPLHKRYGFYVHLAFFVVFAIFVPADWALRSVGLILHFIAPYIWHELFAGRRDEIYDNNRYTGVDLFADAHLGFYLATMTMLWANVTISLIDANIFWNPSLAQLTVAWGLAVGLHRYVLHLIKQRNIAQEQVAELEAELASERVAHSTDHLEVASEYPDQEMAAHAEQPAQRTLSS